MELYIKQRVFSWGDKFSIYNKDGNECYYVQGEVFSWGKKLHLYAKTGMELAFIQQKVFSFLPKYFIFRNGVQTAEVVKEFTFFKQEYSVHGLGWTVKGDFFAHDYEIYDNGTQIASVSKAWLSWGDAYRIVFEPGLDVTNILSVVLVIDACLEQAERSNN